MDLFDLLDPTLINIRFFYSPFLIRFFYFHNFLIYSLLLFSLTKDQRKKIFKILFQFLFSLINTFLKPFQVLGWLSLKILLSVFKDLQSYVLLFFGTFVLFTLLIIFQTDKAALNWKTKAHYDFKESLNFFFECLSFYTWSFLDYSLGQIGVPFKHIYSSHFSNVLSYYYGSFLFYFFYFLKDVGLISEDYKPIRVHFKPLKKNFETYKNVKNFTDFLMIKFNVTNGSLIRLILKIIIDHFFNIIVLVYNFFVSIYDKTFNTIKNIVVFIMGLIISSTISNFLLVRNISLFLLRGPFYMVFKGTQYVILIIKWTIENIRNILVFLFVLGFSSYVLPEPYIYLVSKFNHLVTESINTWGGSELSSKNIEISISYYKFITEFCIYYFEKLVTILLKLRIFFFELTTYCFKFKYCFNPFQVPFSILSQFTFHGDDKNSVLKNWEPLKQDDKNSFLKNGESLKQEFTTTTTTTTRPLVVLIKPETLGVETGQEWVDPFFQNFQSPFGVVANVFDLIGRIFKGLFSPHEQGFSESQKWMLKIYGLSKIHYWITFSISVFLFFFYLNKDYLICRFKSFLFSDHEILSHLEIIEKINLISQEKPRSIFGLIQNLVGKKISIALDKIVRIIIILIYFYYDPLLVFFIDGGLFFKGLSVLDGFFNLILWSLWKFYFFMVIERTIFEIWFYWGMSSEDTNYMINISNEKLSSLSKIIRDLNNLSIRLTSSIIKFLQICGLLERTDEAEKIALNKIMLFFSCLICFLINLVINDVLVSIGIGLLSPFLILILIFAILKFLRWLIDWALHTYHLRLIFYYYCSKSLLNKKKEAQKPKKEQKDTPQTMAQSHTLVIGSDIIFESCLTQLFVMVPINEEKKIVNKLTDDTNFNILIIKKNELVYSGQDWASFIINQCKIFINHLKLLIVFRVNLLGSIKSILITIPREIHQVCNDNLDQNNVNKILSSEDYKNEIQKVLGQSLDKGGLKLLKSTIKDDPITKTILDEVDGLIEESSDASSSKLVSQTGSIIRRSPSRVVRIQGGSGSSATPSGPLDAIIEEQSPQPISVDLEPLGPVEQL